jgi:lipopolysaccharide export LptBFGC system permease protein LptF
MKIIERYIGKCLLKQYATVYFGVIALLFIAQTVKILGYIPASAIKFSYVLKFGGLLMPNALYSGSSIISAIALYFTYNNLVTKNEVIAMKSSGMSIYKIAKPAFIGIAICFVLLFTITFFIVPIANKAFDRGVTHIKDEHVLSILKAGDVVSFKNLSIYYQDLEDDNMINFVILKKQKEPDYFQYYTLYAKSAKIKEDVNGSILVLDFPEISDIKIYNNLNLPIESNTQIAKEMTVSIKSLLDTKTVDKKYINPRDMNIFQLIQMFDKNGFVGEFHKRLSIIYYGIFSSLAIIFSIINIKNNRTNNIRYKLSGLITTGMIIVLSFALPKICFQNENTMLFLKIIINYSTPILVLMAMLRYVRFIK